MLAESKTSHLMLSCSSRSGAALAGSILNAHSKILFSTDKIKYFGFAKERYPKINKENIENLLLEFQLRLKIRWNIDFDINICRNLIGSQYDHDHLYPIFMKCIYNNNTNNMMLGECENMSWMHVPFFLKKIRNSRAMTIIRDPRDVLYSFKKNTIAKKYDYLINVFNSKSLMQSSIKYQKKYNDNFYVIKYEVLKKDMINEVKEICKFLNVKFEKNMLEEKYWLELHGSGWKKWGNLSVSSFYKKEKIISNPVGRWVNNLDPIDQFICEWLLKDEMKYFNYKVNSDLKFNNTLFSKSLHRLMSSNLLRESFFNFLLKNQGNNQLPLDRFNPNNWGGKNNIDHVKLKELSFLMGYQQ